MKNKLALSGIALAILLSMSAANAAEPIEIGEDVRACLDGISIGTNAKSDIICAQNGGIAIGKNVKSNNGVVIGTNSSQSYGSNGNIIGTQSVGLADNVNILGNENNATGANVLGNRNRDVRGNIVGNDNKTIMTNSLMDDPNIYGNRNVITSDNDGAATSVSTAMLGNDNSVKGSNNVVVGNKNIIDANGVSASDSVFVGSSIYTNNASGQIKNGVAIGYNAGIQGNRSIALGSGATATADDCTAIGSGAMCVESKTTAFGDTRLTNIANGIRDTDAAAMGQLTGVARIIGGGTRFENGNLVTPTWYFRDNSTHTTISSALDNLDERIERAGNGGAGQDGYSAYELAQQYGYEGTEREWLASLKGDKGDKGDPGVAGEAGENGQPGRDGQDGGSHGAAPSKVTAGSNVEVSDNEDGTQSVALTDNVKLSSQGSVKVGATTVSSNGVSIKDGPSLTASGVDAGNQRVSNVAAGRIEQGSQDAVNGGQIYDLRKELNDKWEATNRRFDGIEKRLNGLGAQTAAMAMMSASGAGLPVGKVAIQAGVGFNGGASAMAVGYRVRTSEKVSFSAGLSFGRNGTKPMGGVGMSIILD